MIIGSLKNTERTELVSPLFKQAFEYIKTHNLLDAELGEITLQKDDLFIVNAQLEGKKIADAALEAHEVYADIHIVLEGEESIGWKALEDAQEISVPYDTAKDLVFFHGEADVYVNLVPGQFCVVFPEDIHAPAIGNGTIRKLIVKIRM